MSRQSTAVPLKRVREQIREETEARLLSAGEAVFAEQGIQAARVEDIAERAGVAVGTLYNYFGDRDGLLNALAEIRRGDLVRRLDESIKASASLPWRVQLTRFLAATLEEFEVHRRFYVLALQSEIPTARKNCERAAALRDVLQRARRLVLRGVRADALRRGDPALQAAFLVGILRAALLHALLEGREGSMQDLVEPMVAFFLDGAGQ